MIARLHYRWYTPYIFLLPGLILYLIWMIYPLLYQLYISFFKWNPLPGQVSPFVGLQNYQTVLGEPRFWTSLGNSLVYAAVTVGGQMMLGLALAILVHRVIVLKRMFRAIYYIPVITSWVVVSFLFSFLFSSDGGGLINYFLMNVLHVIEKPIAWYSEASTAWISLFTLGIWKGMGWAMVLFLAALQGIPQELYEAAAIDGADEWKQFFNITLPLIRQTTIFVMVALTIGGIQVLISVLLITNGAPVNRTEVVLLRIYKFAFGEFDFGKGAAASYLLSLVIIVASFLQLKLLNRPTDEAKA